MRCRTLEGYKYDLIGTESVIVNITGRVNNDYIRLGHGILIIYEHYAWDGPSGPTIDTKNFMRGSLVHDALYQLMREGLLDQKYRKYADQLLRKICLEDGMSKFRAWYVYHAVRLFARQSSMPRKNPRGKIVDTEKK